MGEPQLHHQTIKVRQLIDDYRAGRIVIPEFQREYVWKPGRAPRLLDSLYRGFPISSLLLWQSSEDVRSRARAPSGRSGPVQWLIDGQQRTITLARALSGDEGIDVVFHPDKEEMRLASATTRRDRAWVRVAELWDDELYRSLRRNLDGSQTADQHEGRFERVRRILDYEVPLLRMVDHRFDDAVEAFSRINTLGVKLKREDIESAKVAAIHSGFIADQVAPFLDSLRKRGFARMSVMHLFRACAFVAHPDGRSSRTPLHELSQEAVQSAWSRTVAATDEALDLLRTELHITNMEVLWSGAPVVPVIALCATVGKRERDARAIAGWVALAALVHRYSGSATTGLDQDLRACRSSDALGALLTNLRQQRSRLLATADDFDGSLADRSGLLALYLACLHRSSGAPSQVAVNAGKSPSRQPLFPRSLLDEASKPLADSLANTALLPEGAPKMPWSKGPAAALKSWSAQMLADQCIPADADLWKPERASDFWAARKALLAEAFNELTRAALPRRQL
jgi:hypothetical protein